MAGVCVSGGSSSREESTLGGGGSFSGLMARNGQGGGRVLSQILGFMERLLFSYLERSGGEIARLRVKADSVGLYGSERFRYLRTVIRSAPGSCGFGGEVVVYGYKGFPSFPTTPSSFASRLLVQFTPCVGDGLLSGFNLALHCDNGCGDGSRESLVIPESASSPSSHPSSVVLVLSQSAVVLQAFLRRY
ncbi:hypothetical protein F2Q69_00031034 [Brassica cretica]|uniref:Uncharacterized protein n=1 Tax=Brassica cretica TaxID=69181 RepID=A0A8S9RZH6_BRACR|nr:hypothetical protein F2Q69_00031034 [Brassica cretica]